MRPAPLRAVSAMACSRVTLPTVSSPSWRFSGAPAPIDVEQAGDGVEAHSRPAPVEDRGGGVGLEVDHRRAQHLGLRLAAQDLAGRGGELEILAVVPDPPLAAVDRLADLEAAAKRPEALAELLHRCAPARRVAHQLAVLRQGEGQLVAGRRQPRGQLLLRAVVPLPGMEAQQTRPDAELLDRRQQALGVGLVRAQRHADAAPGPRLAVERRRQPAVAAPDARRRGERRRRRARRWSPASASRTASRSSRPACWCG